MVICEPAGAGISIRRLDQTPGELAQVLEVYRQCEDFLALGPVPTASMKMVMADLALSREAGRLFCGIYHLASSEMIGVVDFAPFGYHQDPSLADLSLLMIAAPYRGKGLGEVVVRAVEGQIRQAGQASTIVSGVQVNNPGAIRFWQRMGYRVVSGPKLQADGTTTYDLEKSIGW